MTPVNKYFYSESEWNRLGCGPLPESRIYHVQSENEYLVYPEPQSINSDEKINPYSTV
jgi:hypothetical protein